MATIEHKLIPETDLHEPKGVSTALANAIYVADGIGSGTWKVPSYAEMYVTSGAGVVALPAASAYTRVDTAGTIWTGGSYGDVTINAATGEFTIITTGVYNIAMWIVFQTASLAAGTAYNFKYAVDGVTTARTVTTTKQTAGVDVLDTSATGVAPLTAGNVLSLHVGGDGTSSSTDITIKEAGFSIHRI